jgi:hypothetical protein
MTVHHIFFDVLTLMYHEELKRIREGNIGVLHRQDGLRIITRERMPSRRLVPARALDVMPRIMRKDR